MAVCPKKENKCGVDILSPIFFFSLFFSYLGQAFCVSLLLKDPAINPTLLFQERTALQLAQPSSRADGWEFLEEQIKVEGRQTVVQLLDDAGAQ